MRVVYSPAYRIEIGPHVFLTEKYARVVEQLAARGRLTANDLLEPPAVSWEALGLVHGQAYLTRVRNGTLGPDELAEIELPWSPTIVDGFRQMTGGTVLAARVALADGLGIHIGGGFHHAFAHHGEGFCFFNDVALAIRTLQGEGAVERAGIIDLDVHHGNGTAMIFEQDPSVFTCSLHQQHNYPLFKPRSSLDIGLPDGIADDAYLEALRQALPRVLAAVPDIVFYLAGADPYRDDQLGGLALTREGLRRRDELVIDTVMGARSPLVILLAGGYARHLEDTVAIHVATIEAALDRSPPPGRPS